jgi:hypothetical protein
MLLAEQYAQDFAAFNPRSLPDYVARLPACPFVPEGTVLIDRGDPDLRQVLPEAFRFVAISCLTMGSTYFSEMALGAEQEMLKVLEVKDRTGGLSTDALGGRNLHPWLAPLPLVDADRACAAVAQDRRFPLSGSAAKVASLDIAHAVLPLEQHTSFEGVAAGPVTIDSAAGTPVVYRASDTPQGTTAPRSSTGQGEQNPRPSS